jgi:hypothetical protein
VAHSVSATAERHDCRKDVQSLSAETPGRMFFSVVRKSYSRIRSVPIPAAAALKLGSDDIGVCFHEGWLSLIRIAAKAHLCVLTVGTTSLIQTADVSVSHRSMSDRGFEHAHFCI